MPLGRDAHVHRLVVATPKLRNAEVFGRVNDLLPIIRTEKTETSNVCRMTEGGGGGGGRGSDKFCRMRKCAPAKTWADLRAEHELAVPSLSQTSAERPSSHDHRHPLTQPNISIRKFHIEVRANTFPLPSLGLRNRIQEP